MEYYGKLADYIVRKVRMPHYGGKVENYGRIYIFAYTCLIAFVTEPLSSLLRDYIVAAAVNYFNLSCAAKHGHLTSVAEKHNVRRFHAHCRNGNYCCISALQN